MLFVLIMFNYQEISASKFPPFHDFDQEEFGSLFCNSLILKIVGNGFVPAASSFLLLVLLLVLLLLVLLLPLFLVLLLQLQFLLIISTSKSSVIS